MEHKFIELSKVYVCNSNTKVHWRKMFLYKFILYYFMIQKTKFPKKFKILQSVHIIKSSPGVSTTTLAHRAIMKKCAQNWKRICWKIWNRSLYLFQLIGFGEFAEFSKIIFQSSTTTKLDLWTFVEVTYFNYFNTILYVILEIQAKIKIFEKFPFGLIFGTFWDDEKIWCKKSMACKVIMLI